MNSKHPVAEQDEFAKLLGVELLEVGHGTARARMRISPRHMNGMGMVHGGAIFGLADFVFAAACNSHDGPAVAVNVNISYLKAPRGEFLTAEGAENSAGKIGSYTVRVLDEGGELVALFQGMCYRKRPAALTP